LSQFVKELRTKVVVDKDSYEATLKGVTESNECGAGRLIHPLRLALSGVGVGPGIYDLLLILGKEEVVGRIQIALQEIPKLIDE